MSIQRTTKHLVLIFLTVSVLVVMLFIPDLFLRYLDKNSAAVITEKSSPVTLELKSGLSLCRKAFVASYSSSREELVSSEADSDRLIMESEALKICDTLSLGMEITRSVPVCCTLDDTNESVIVWHIILNSSDMECTMVLDDETMGLLYFDLIYENEPYKYIREDIMDISYNLRNLINKYYFVRQTNFMDDRHVEYEEIGTGILREVQISYDLLIFDNDNANWIFQLFVDPGRICFGL